MLIALCIIVILTLLFLPLRLVIDLSYNKTLKYKCLLYILKVKAITITDSNASNHEKKEKSNFEFKKVLKLLSRLKDKPVKPSIRISSTVDLHLFDASFTCIFSGLFYNVYTMFFFYIRDLFFIKEYRYNISPHFSMEDYFVFSLNSSISFNLLKAIYFYILFKKNWR